MYNREPILSIHIQYHLNLTDNGDDNEDPFDTEIFETILSATLSLRKGTHENAGTNILKGTTTVAMCYLRLCTLINQHDNEISKKYKFGLLKPYFHPAPRPDGGNIDVSSDEKTPVQDAENPDLSDPQQHSQEAVPVSKVDSSYEKPCYPSPRKLHKCYRLKTFGVNYPMKSLYGFLSCLYEIQVNFYLLFINPRFNILLQLAIFI